MTGQIDNPTSCEMASNQIRFGFYTSNRATRLCRFLKSPLRGSTAIEVVVHDGERSENLERLCRLQGINLVCADYAVLGLSGKERNAHISDLLLKEFRTHHVDYCFCFGSRLLVGSVLEVYRNRIVNFHPALLPSFPGRKAIDQAIEHGAVLFGNTAHFVDEGTDTGPVIMQSVLPRSAFDGYDSVLDLQLPMLAQIIRWLQEDRVMVDGRAVRIRDVAPGEPYFSPASDLAL